MSTPVLVYAAENTASRLRSRLVAEARPGWERLIRIKSLPAAKRLLSSQRKSFDDPSSPESEISRICNQERIDRVFIERSLKIRTAQLDAQGIRTRPCSGATIVDEVLRETHRLRLHWVAHSTSEWEKAGIRYLNPNAWQQQFDEFGQSWVAEGILKQLRVISDADLRAGLAVSEQETLGLRTSHGCVRDDEPGNSSVNVRDLLEHTYPTPVHKIDFSQQPSGMENVDHLFIYEDGLWSGVELVERLQLLATWPLVKSRELRVTFRFAATSQAGLFAARHFLRREKLSSVEVSIGRSAHFEHLQPGSVELLLKSPNLSDDEVRKAIDQAISPLAFMDDSIWLGHSAEAISFCKTIGDQLVRPWITRTKGLERIDERADKWALGAYGYASVTAFSKSVPKPVLPLIWLNGPVTYGGKVVNWRPLFWDSRRTGIAPPALGRATAP